MAVNSTLTELRQLLVNTVSGTDGDLLSCIVGAGVTYTIDITGTPTGGTYKLSFGGAETGTIAHNANAATVELAVEGLSTIAAGEGTITGTNPNFTLTLTGDTQFTPEVLTLSDNSLTGGTAPSVTITEVAQNNTMLALWSTIAAELEDQINDDPTEEMMLQVVNGHMQRLAIELNNNIR